MTASTPRVAVLVTSQNNIDRPRKALVLVCRRHVRRQFLDVVGGVAHRDREAAVLEHRQVVLHVADGGDRIGRDALTFGDRLHKSALVAAGRGDIEIIALRSDGRGLRSQCPLHRGFATLQQSRIGAGADDLAGRRQIGFEIPNNGRIGADGVFFVQDVFAIVVATRLFASDVKAYFKVGAGVSGFDFALSMALFAVGHLVGLWVGVAMLLGALIGWGWGVPHFSALATGLTGGAEEIAGATARTYVWEMRRARPTLRANCFVVAGHAGQIFSEERSPTDF